MKETPPIKKRTIFLKKNSEKKKEKKIIIFLDHDNQKKISILQLQRKQPIIQKRKTLPKKLQHRIR